MDKKIDFGETVNSGRRIVRNAVRSAITALTIIIMGVFASPIAATAAPMAVAAPPIKQGLMDFWGCADFGIINAAAGGISNLVGILLAIGAVGALLVLALGSLTLMFARSSLSKAQEGVMTMKHVGAGAAMAFIGVPIIAVIADGLLLAFC